MDSPEAYNMVRPSQGVHLIVDSSFLGGDTAIMIPKTSDGRVLFVVPWHDNVILGTTDHLLMSSYSSRGRYPKRWILYHHAGQYLKRQPALEDVLCVYAGPASPCGAQAGCRPRVRPRALTQP